jgi:hypothetical protein
MSLAWTVEAGSELFFLGAVSTVLYTVFKVATASGAHKQEVRPASHLNDTLLSNEDLNRTISGQVDRKVTTITERPGSSRLLDANGTRKWLVRFADGTYTYMFSVGKPEVDARGFLVHAPGF